MLERRYEFFISSTSADLKTERDFVQYEVLRRGHIPVAMELFDPGYEDAWNIIKTAIESCDYYVVIIATRYGSTGRDGVSYTEKEFQYALEKKKPIIVYLLSDEAIQDWDKALGNGDSVVEERLLEFRQRVALHRNVNYWKDRTDLKSTIQRTLFSWMDRHPRSGWVRATKYEEVGFKRDVYTYLFNQLNPFDDVRVTEQFIRALDKPLTTIDNVLYALNLLIKDFVARQLRPEIRVYFAFPLRKPVPMYAAPDSDKNMPSGPGEALFCFGISSERRRQRALDSEELEESPWMEGYLAGGESNIANVFRRRKIITVRDARRSRMGSTQNQVVPDEGSVIGTPVLYGTSRHPNLHALGVVGLSSPVPAELDTQDYRDLAEEIQSLFSALFFAYGQWIEREQRRGIGDGQMAARLRREIANHYEETFAGNYPNLYRSE
jgi:hypothetical protein